MRSPEDNSDKNETIYPFPLHILTNIFQKAFSSSGQGWGPAFLSMITPVYTPRLLDNHISRKYVIVDQEANLKFWHHHTKARDGVQYTRRTVGYHYDMWILRYSYSWRGLLFMWHWWMVQCSSFQSLTDFNLYDHTTWRDYHIRRILMNLVGMFSICIKTN